MSKKPRSWNKIIKQEGTIGILKGEDLEIEYRYKYRK